MLGMLLILRMVEYVQMGNRGQEEEISWLEYQIRRYKDWRRRKWLGNDKKRYSKEIRIQLDEQRQPEGRAFGTGGSRI